MLLIVSDTSDANECWCTAFTSTSCRHKGGGLHIHLMLHGSALRECDHKHRYCAHRQACCSPCGNSLCTLQLQTGRRMHASLSCSCSTLRVSHAQSLACSPIVFSSVQVHRIQNKLLWAAYAGSLAAMKVRWRLDPRLALVNGGASTLWHGTSKADPWDIYAAEFGGSPS